MSQRILVLAPNWLGDAVMALPAVADVRRAMPEATIDVAARPSIAPLIPLIPTVNAAVPLSSRDAGADIIRAGRYDIALLLPNSFASAWMVYRAGVPERWGYRNEFRAMLLTRAVVPPTRVHQASYYQQLTEALGFVAGPLEPRLEVPGDLRTIGEERLSAAGWDAGTPLVAVAPGAAFGGAKRWPADRFAATIDALAKDGVRSVLIGAGADARAGAEVMARVHTGLRPLDLIGATDLSALAGVLVHCRALVTNDSGAMHFAAALGMNVTAIFGPTNEAETRPLGRGRRGVVHTEVWCRPCMLRECPLTHRCMTHVTSDAVLQDLRQSL
ncbi:MAG: lipopolysaccharide heptosyltransferase II [Acidobacteria bacterium]|nr:lipopolysaccharide heptosyltransferase II [Acidobacteriota bacterium]